jgi:uncharacterized membrane protein (Fun14 family)
LRGVGLKMVDNDITQLIGQFLSAWAVGFVAGYIMRAFRRAAGVISR